MAVEAEGLRPTPYGRIYAVYTASLVAFGCLLAVLSALGVPDLVVGSLFLAFTFALYASIGLFTPTIRIKEFYAAGRRVPAMFNGLATAAGMVSATSFVGMVGALYLLGRDGFVYVLGAAGGFFVSAVLIAPYLNRSGAYTLPDFLSARFGPVARLAALVVLIGSSFAALVAQFHGFGAILSQFVGLDAGVAGYIGLAAATFLCVFGGMRSVTWAQVGLGIVLVAAVVVPAGWIMATYTSLPISDLAFGQRLPNLAAFETEAGITGIVFSAESYDGANFVLAALCLMIGTACLPHLATRAMTTESAAEARTSNAWSLFFVAILCIAAPIFAAVARFPVPEDIVTEATTPALGPDMVALAVPQMAGLPYIVTALVAIGGLAAMLAAACGLLITIANSVSHDFYFKTLDRNAPAFRRLLATRLLLLAIVAAAAYAAQWSDDLLVMMSWAFSLAASGFFPALALGIWWKRANAVGAVLGIIAGFGACLYYLVGTRYGAIGFVETWSWMSSATTDQLDRFAELKAAYDAAAPAAKEAALAALLEHARAITNWFGVNPLSAAIFGMPIGFVVAIAASLATRMPAAERQVFVDALHGPNGGTVIDDPVP
jgi:cation/acetate symporter